MLGSVLSLRDSIELKLSVQTALALCLILLGLNHKVSMQYSVGGWNGDLELNTMPVNVPPNNSCMYCACIMKAFSLGKKYKEPSSQLTQQCSHLLPGLAGWVRKVLLSLMHYFWVYNRIIHKDTEKREKDTATSHSSLISTVMENFSSHTLHIFICFSEINLFAILVSRTEHRFLFI